MQQINVLLVDDNEDILELLTTSLRDAHLVVEAATSGAEALEMLGHYRPDVIVADIAMPGMSGYELLERVRELGVEDVPFIFVTALGEIQNRVKGLRLGADDYVVKPLDPEELLLRVRLQIEKRRRLRLVTELAEAGRPFGLMNGTLGEFSVAELLQMVAFLGLPDVCVRLETTTRGVGEVYLTRGRVLHAQTERASGERALDRLLRWREGSFRILHRSHDGPPTVSGPIERILLDGLTAADHYGRLSSELGSGRAPLIVEDSRRLFERTFDEPTAATLLLVESYRTLDDVLDRSALGDLATLVILDGLLRSGVIAPSLSAAT
ncbi:MAG TPA: response regulator [Thermoanaerobaculia bacterium]|nr:response regulator [Thermoanaerobaculia bacterium]